MKNCYYCGFLLVKKGREHAPPQMMFKGFDCDSLTVPSCDIHNTKKSRQDQAIVHGFFKSLIPYKETLHGDVLKAFCIAESAFEHTKKTAVISPILKNPSRGFKELPDLAYLPPEIRMHDWIRQLTAALVFSVTKTYDGSIIWDKIKIESPDWIYTNGPETIDEDGAVHYFEEMRKKKNLMSKLSWELGWSASPRPYPGSIYKFFVHLSSNEIIIHHIFYERFNWYAWIQASEKLIGKIKSKTYSA